MSPAPTRSPVMLSLGHDQPMQHGEGAPIRAGMSLMQACNPFGGEEACMTLSSTSKFAEVCQPSSLKVRAEPGTPT